jgi:predicted anti-sigma-YlaC factor YlaD
MDMGCDRIREAVSARIDSEDPGLPPGALEAHLAECAACREWEQRAYVVTRHARLGVRYLGHDLTARVLAAVPSQAAWRQRRAQLAITVPLLIARPGTEAVA